LILFNEIFARAVNLFDDPDINYAYVNNKVSFSKLMRPYLINGISKFTNPFAISSLLNQQTTEAGQLEVFEGTGVDTYSTTIIPLPDSDISFLINGKTDYGAIYNEEENEVIFSRTVEEGSVCSIEWYYAGAFSANFDNVFPSVSFNNILERVKDILAHCLLLAWAEKNKNFILEIRNILTDTDFRLYSPAASLTSKISWYNNIMSELNSSVSKLTWDIRIAGVGGRKLG
jgi:hypothetical protein